MTQQEPNKAPEPLANLNASPFNPLPWPVWLVIVIIAVIEMALWLGGKGLIGGPGAVGWRLDAIQRFGFSSAIQSWMLEVWRFPLMHLLRYPAYSLIHAGTMHAFFVIVLVAALGKYVAEPFGNRAFLALLALPPMAGAAVFGLVLGKDVQGWLIGGMPLVFGLVGALTWWRWQSAPDRDSRLRAFGVIGVLLAARLGFGLIAEIGHGWIGELAAFGFGFGLSTIVGPGRLPQITAWLRAR